MDRWPGPQRAVEAYGFALGASANAGELNHRLYPRDLATAMLADAYAMTVPELRRELRSRAQPDVGNRADLRLRVQDLLGVSDADATIACATARRLHREHVASLRAAYDAGRRLSQGGDDMREAERERSAARRQSQRDAGRDRERRRGARRRVNGRRSCKGNYCRRSCKRAHLLIGMLE